MPPIIEQVRSLKASNFAGWTFITRQGGRFTPEQFIVNPVFNPIICFPGDGGLSQNPEAKSVAHCINKMVKDLIPENEKIIKDIQSRILSFGYQKIDGIDTGHTSEVERANAVILFNNPD